MTVPIFFVTVIPSDFYAEGTLRERWFMRDEAYLTDLYDDIQAILGGSPPPAQQARLERARDLSVTPALNSISSRAGLTWEDLHLAHEEFMLQCRQWFQSGAASNDKSYAWDFDGKMVYAPLVMGGYEMDYHAQAWNGTSYDLDKLIPSPPDDVFTQTTPDGYGVYTPLNNDNLMNAIHARIHSAYPEAMQEVGPDWLWTYRNGSNEIVGTMAVMIVNGGGWYGTWPRIKDSGDMRAWAFYGAEAHFRGKVLGIPDPYHIMAAEWPTRGWGESHEAIAHGVGNINCHSDMTGQEANNWTTLQQQTTARNADPLRGAWLIPAQVDQMLNAATVGGTGGNDILIQVAKPDPIIVLPNNKFQQSFFPELEDGTWEYNGTPIASTASLTAGGGTLEVLDGDGVTVSTLAVTLPNSTSGKRPKRTKRRIRE